MGKMSSIIVPDGPSRLPWSMTIGELLDCAVSRNPHKVYLYYQKHQVTYQKFLDYSLRVGGLFQQLGVSHGDRVCLFLPNGPEFLYIWMGLSHLGAICVPINTAYKQAEMAYILNNAEARALVSHHTLIDVAREAAGQCPSLQDTLVVASGEVNCHSERNEESIEGQTLRFAQGDNSSGTYPGWKDFWRLLEEAPVLARAEGAGAPHASPVQPKDTSMLVYTSGTTGNPKGVIITHEMYVAAGQGFATWTSATSEDRFFTCLPYFHANAQYYSTMGSLAVGASLIVADRFSASRFWDQIRASQATIVNFIGMMMPVLLKQSPSDHDGDNSVRLFYGSPALAPEVLAEFEERFGAKVIVGFALTECCYGTIERQGQPHRRGSAGQPRWHPDSRFQNELRIVDDGNILPSGKAGEITLRSPAVMPAYWHDPERTREALRDGWLYTGDLGLLDEDGYLYFVDRKKDVVRRRGENISSQEVEDVIKSHPAVLDCAVIAVPSELGEEEVKAYVVPRAAPTVSSGDPSPSGRGIQSEGEMVPLRPEDVVYWCAERLAHFKVPRYVEFRNDLPRTPSFRVRKDILRREQEDLTSGCFDREKAGIRVR